MRLIEQVRAKLPQLQDFQARVDKLRAEIEVAAKDGLTLAEICELSFAATGDLVEAAIGIPVEGSEKKSLVTEQALALIGLLLPALPLPVWLAPARPLINRLLMSAAGHVLSGAIEAILSRIKSSFKTE